MAKERRHGCLGKSCVHQNLLEAWVFGGIELFNLGMLARQAWRILQNPEALTARILKAVYYPNTDLLAATLGSSHSQVWRALVEGRDVMQ